MARKPRVHFPGALYHVIVRGNKGQKVFRRKEDFNLYLRLLGEYKEVFDFVLCAHANARPPAGRSEGHVRDLGAKSFFLTIAAPNGSGDIPEIITWFRFEKRFVYSAGGGFKKAKK